MWKTVLVLTGSVLLGACNNDDTILVPVDGPGSARWAGRRLLQSGRDRLLGPGFGVEWRDVPGLQQAGR